MFKYDSSIASSDTCSELRILTPNTKHSSYTGFAFVHGLPVVLLISCHSCEVRARSGRRYKGVRHLSTISSQAQFLMFRK
ncbi:hypothetical protein BofuT4_uP080620.1 [Botrytis cinerea T4]|uniref:Uncharacterized protein n=1 Tax=Botryotinia fuckeliana (strain T4) TaxID=999810 RepID=G2YKW9_BOTF4|nr:hypothetical protein BofuT4_uP080620.1 [Botrytis cinerea T4]